MGADRLDPIHPSVLRPSRHLWNQGTIQQVCLFRGRLSFAPDDISEDAGTSAPPSLKSLAQSRLLDTLDPSERVQLVTTILGKLSPAELSSIPLAALAAATDAHAAADHTRACLEVLPELRSRLVVSKYSDNTSNFGVNMSYGSNYSLSATYELLRPHTADRRTLKVKVTRGDFSKIGRAHV